MKKVLILDVTYIDGFTEKFTFDANTHCSDTSYPGSIKIQLEYETQSSITNEIIKCYKTVLIISSFRTVWQDIKEVE
jgi:hypothetical protein